MDYNKSKYSVSHWDTLGYQLCPFGANSLQANCFKWSEDVKVTNKETGRALWMNSGTVHMARAHNFLEKGNKYGITPTEFYQHFMH